MTGRPLSLPSWERLAAGIAGALVVSAVFFPVYIGGAAIAGARGHPLHLYAGIELAIPFLPFMIVPYLSMFVLFVAPPLQLEPRELGQLVARLVLASLVSGLIFLCLPSEVGFADRSDAGAWQPLYDAIYAIDGHFNAVPSFHVIYTASILLIMSEVATPRLRIAYVVWLAVVCASTVLTHRHHLLDVAFGLAIAFAVRAVMRTKLPAPVRGAEVSR
jgi:membrane-associated phospholipid phosphatase